MLLALTLLATQAIDPATPPPSRYPRVEIKLANGRLTVPRLRHGERYALRLTNVSPDVKRFELRTFFRQARIVPSRVAYIRNGGVLVRPGRSVELLLAAPMGRGGYIVRAGERLGLGWRTILWID